VGEACKTTEGAGLGLAITRRLIDLMQGTLSVDSEIGKGSRFTVDLPLQVVEGIETSAEQGKTKVVGYQGERKRILVVDDNVTNLSMLVSLLEPLDFEMITAGNGQEAMWKAVEYTPDMILLDFVMPVMDGLEAAKEFREHPELQQTPIIGVSATVVDNERKHAFVSACDDFLPKPVESHLLLDKIQACLHLEWEVEEREIPKTGKISAKIPPENILDDICHNAELGFFSHIRHILDDIVAEDADYTLFCNIIRTYIEQYDNEGILAYIKTCRMNLAKV
jgi:CheY-like chemotaxis protein